MLAPVWEQRFLGIPGAMPGIFLPVVGLAVFFCLVWRALRPLCAARSALWRDRPAKRLANLARLGLLQTRQARYAWHALAHGLIFYGFVFSFPHLWVMVWLGLPGAREFSGPLWQSYLALCDGAATAVIAGCLLAAFCRLGPYASRYPAGRTTSAFGILAFVFVLTAAEICCRSAVLAAQPGAGLPFSLARLVADCLRGVQSEVHNAVAAWAWLAHELLFFSFLCILPVSKQFHEILGLASLWCMRLDKGNVKPCRYGLSDEALDELPHLGVGSLNDCPWTQLLHFSSCADCGRCSANCPAALAGRELSPRDFSFKGRVAMGVKGMPAPWTAEEVWACALCGACEEECPLGIGYLDVITDLRRHAVERGRIPQGVSKAMDMLQRRATPLAAKPGVLPWLAGTRQESRYRETGGKLLYLPSAFTTHAPLARPLADAVYEILTLAGHEPVLLPGVAPDAGHEARRWGDEYLYRALRDALAESLNAAQPSAVVTEDPHTLNALRNDYGMSLPIRHISEFFAEDLAQGRLSAPVLRDGRLYAFHDPCYLGRHNGLYASPRSTLRALGLSLTELPRHKDRALCCGGPLAFFHEPKEKRRPACLRLEEAVEAGVEVLVTACPWCFAALAETSRAMGLSLTVRDLALLVRDRVVVAPL